MSKKTYIFERVKRAGKTRNSQNRGKNFERDAFTRETKTSEFWTFIEKKTYAPWDGGIFGFFPPLVHNILFYNKLDLSLEK